MALFRAANNVNKNENSFPINNNTTYRLPTNAFRFVSCGIYENEFYDDFIKIHISR